MMVFCLTMAEQENLFVKHSATTYTSESRWLAAFPLDLNIYKTRIKTLAHHLDDITEFALHCKTLIAKHGREEHYDPIIDLIWNQIRFAKEKVKKLDLDAMEIIGALKANSTKDGREKRSLLPFLGNILNQITGVATEKDVENINLHIKTLAQEDIEITNIVQESITVVNATKHEIGHIS